MELIHKRLANLMSVKSIVTLVLTGVFSYMAVTGNISQDFMTIYAVIIAFYFGTQSQKVQDAVGGDDNVSMTSISAILRAWATRQKPRQGRRSTASRRDWRSTSAKTSRGTSTTIRRSSPAAGRSASNPPEMEEYMDQATFNKMMDAYLAQLRTKPVSTWAAKDWAAAKAAGITDGSAPHGLITRQEAAMMIQRATK